MLRYIHQFVQSFLKEASKTRPRSRSRSSVDLAAKDKSTVKPEILAIDYNEGPEADRSKEILELKRKYSLLMKKFVNPNLDLMTNTGTSNDVNHLNLKGKQEIIRSVLSRIFYERREQNKLEGSKDFIEESKNTAQEESSVGWSGQRTSKLAAIPMVETPSKSKNIASALTSFPDDQKEPPINNVRQNDKALGDRSTLTSKSQHVKPKKHINTKLKYSYMVGSNFRDPKSSDNVEQEKNLVDDIADTSITAKKQRETKTEYEGDEPCSGRTERDLIKDIYGQNIDISKQNHLQIYRKLENRYTREREDLTKYNQKENLNIIRTITKVDKNKLAKSNVDNSKLDQNEAIQKQPTTVTNLKSSTGQTKLKAGLSKNNELIKDSKVKEKKEQITHYSVNPEELLSDTFSNGLRPPSDINKNIQNSDQPEINPIEKVELSKINNNNIGERSSETEVILEDELTKLVKENTTIDKEQNQKSYKTPEITQGDSKDQPQSFEVDQAMKRNEESCSEPLDEKSKSSENSYWSLLSDKMLKTTNSAQKFVDNLEITKWKTKTIETTQALAKNLTGIDLSDKQNAVEASDEPSKNYDKTCTSGSDNTCEVRDTTGKAQVSENIPSTKTKNKHLANKNLEASVPQAKAHQRSKTKSKDFKLKKVNINPTIPSHDLKQNEMKNKSSNDISLIKPNNNLTKTEEKEMNSELKCTENCLKTKNTDCVISQDFGTYQTEIQPEEINSNYTVKNVVPEENGKIKKLLRQFKKLEKRKSKQNVKNSHRKYGKIPNEEKVHKFQLDKEKSLVHEERRAKRSKSDRLDKTLDSDIPATGVSYFSPVALSTNPLGKNRSDVTLNQNKFSKTVDGSARGVNVNRVDSNIFPTNSPQNQYINLIEHEHTTGTNEPNLTKLERQSSKHIEQQIQHHKTTNKALAEARKLHSRKEFCKPSKKLKMYGARRSIYTLSNPKSSENEFESRLRKDIVEPNMASGSLIYVTGLTSEKHKSKYPIRTQVRNMHVSGFGSKAKHLTGRKKMERRKRNTVINRYSKTKHENVESAKKCLTDQSVVQTSKEDKMKRSPSQAMVTNLSTTNQQPSDLTNVKLAKENTIIKEDLNEETQGESTDNNKNCTLKGSNNTSTSKSSGKSKKDHKTEVIYSKLEKDKLLPPLSNSKENKLSDTQCNTTTKPTESTNMKNTEAELNLAFLNEVILDQNEERINSPKWMSKEDRLKKWKLEIESECAEENKNYLDRNVSEDPENNPSPTQTKCNEVDKNNDALVRQEEKKENQVECVAKNDVSKNVIFLNDLMDKSISHKKEQNNTITGVIEKKVKAEPENKILSKDIVNESLQHTNKNIPDHTKVKSNNVAIKNQLSKELDDKKKEDSNNKIKEFELKLRALETKVKALEFKSIEQKSTESVLLKDDSKNTTKYLLTQNTSDKNKTGNKEKIMIPNSLLEKNDHESQNKINNLSFSIKNESKAIKDPNDIIREELTQKVKTLELKLKSLESKVLNLKENLDYSSLKSKEMDTKSCKDMDKKLTKESKSENVTEAKSTLNTNTHKFVRHSHLHKDQINALNIQNKIHSEAQNKEKFTTSTIVHAKPEMSAKNYLTTDKNKIEDLTIVRAKSEMSAKNYLTTDKNKIEDLTIVRAKPEISAKNYLTTDKNKIEDQTKNQIKNKNSGNSGKKSDLTLSKNTIAQKIPTLKKIQILKPIEKTEKQISQAKDMRSSETGGTKKVVTSGTSGINSQQIKVALERTVQTPASTVSYRKGIKTSQIGKGDNVVAKQINQNVVGPKINDATFVTNKTLSLSGKISPGKTLPLSCKTVPLSGKAVPLSGKTLPLIGKTLPLTGKTLPLSGNVKTSEKNMLVHSSNPISTPPSQKGSNKTPLKSNSSPQKCCDSNKTTEQKIIKVRQHKNGMGNSKKPELTGNVSKKVSKKAVPFIISKRRFLKRKPFQGSRRGLVDLDSGSHAKNKVNPLHEGLLKSSRWLNSKDGFEQIDCSIKSGRANIDGNSEKKVLPVNANKHSPAQLNKLSKAIPVLKSPITKQDLNDKNKAELQKDLNSTNSWKSDDETPIKLKRPNRKEKKFNSFDYYKPQRRAYEIKHPIEREKNGIKFLSKSENILDKFYPKQLSQSFSTHCENSSKSNKKEKAVPMIQKEHYKYLSTLMSQKIPISVINSIQK